MYGIIVLNMQVKMWKFPNHLFLNRRITSSGDAEKIEGPRILFTGITPSEVSRLTEVCKVLI